MLRTVILILILLLVLSFFGVSVQHIVESPTGQSNFSYVGDLLQQVWDDLLEFLDALWYNIVHLV